MLLSCATVPRVVGFPLWFKRLRCASHSQSPRLAGETKQLGSQLSPCARLRLMGYWAGMLQWEHRVANCCYGGRTNKPANAFTNISWILVCTTGANGSGWCEHGGCCRLGKVGAHPDTRMHPETIVGASSSRLGTAWENAQ